MRSIGIAAALAASGALAGPSDAQFGRLIPATDLTALFKKACIDIKGDPSASVPRLATVEKWDELGRSTTTKPGTRGWLVSLNGLPAIVDIARNGSREECSASSVADPGQVSAAIGASAGSPHPIKSAGDRKVVEWPASRGSTISLTTSPGQAMARLTARYGAR